jgi:hypothetical protein
MADIKVEYTLTTGAGTITFNDGALGDGVDKYWLESIQGLDGPSIRAPVDLVPFGDGGIIHTFRKGPRRVVFDGMLLMESSTSQADCQEIRNNLAWDLKDALASILTTSGTLAWTPTGESGQSLSVYYEVGVDFPYSNNYMVQNFSFGLISAAADPS